LAAAYPVSSGFTGYADSIVVGGTPGAFTFTFSGPFAATNMKPLVFTGTNVTPVAATLVDGIGNEVQTATFSTSGMVGKMIYNANTNDVYTSVPANDIQATFTFTTGVTTASDVRKAINAVPGFAGNVAVLGPVGGPFDIIFTNNLGQTNLEQITGVDNSA